nr:putative ribonuclease H-like domain-containing protein [Tanacetum cinerariifolium]
MRPFGCLVTILNTLDPLGKFDGKADEGFLVGYSINCKAFRVFNSRTRIVQETLHINVLENKPNVAGIGPKWLFDIETLTMSMNYQPVATVSAQQYVLLPLWSTGSQDLQNTDDDVDDAAFDVKENEHDVHVSSNGSDKTDNKKHDKKAKRDDKGKSHVDSLIGVRDLRAKFEEFLLTALIGPSINAVSPNFRIARKSSFMDPSKFPDDPDMPELEDIVYSDDDEEDSGVEADLSNLEINILGKPKKVLQELKDPSWIEAMQEELLQFKLQKVWVLVDLHKGKRVKGSKWFFKNKKDERGIVIGNKARFVEHGYTQEEGIDYDEVFAPVARIEAIWLLLAYASYMGFMVYQMDVKSDFLYGTIEERYMFVNLQDLKTLIILIRFTRWSKHSMGCIKLQELGLQVKKKDDGIFISQDNYVAEILRKFVFINVKSVSTPIETEKPLLKDPDGEDWIIDEDASKQGGKIAAIDAGEGITLVDVEIDKDVVAMDAESQGRLNQEDVNAASKGVSVISAPELVSVVEQIVFDDEDVTMTMAQTLIKLKVEKAKLLDEHIAQKLHDEEFDDKEENINRSAVAEQVQERHLDSIKKYQNLKKKPVSIAQARKNMIIYLKNMVGYKMEFFRGMTYDKESFKKLKAAEVSGSESTQEIPSNDPKEMNEEDLQNMLEIVPVPEFKVKALQVKYPIIDWEIHTEGSRIYWKIIRVRGITEAYQIFEDMLKGFDREDHVALWNLVKEKFSSAEPSEDKEKALWVELKRLFESDADVLWKLQRSMHAPLTWKLYSDCGVHHVSSTRGHDIFMLTEKCYPLSNAVMILMLSRKLQVEEDNEMARDLVMKIFMEANKLRSRSLDTSS